MSPNVKAAFRQEMNLANAAEMAGNFILAKQHLERGHILGQQSYLSHMESHYRMFRLARKQSDVKEARGQIVRLIGAGPFHLAGWIPIGNTGGADVSPILPMAIPADIQPYFDGFSLRNGLIVRLLLLVIALFALLTFS